MNNSSLSVLALMLVLLVSNQLNAQEQEVIIPYNTMVVCELTGTVTLDDKPGKEVEMKVQRDVVVNGKVVIAKDAAVYATIRVNKKPKSNYYTGEEGTGELLIDIISVKAVDGTVVNLNSCYFQRYAEKNHNWFDKQRRWVLAGGAVKNCQTSVKTTVKVP
ncbi:MAG: hypothetical protein KIS94_03145 [Chitinophagales bacterium]|nr:hypothetical protein [Chitinophagales bacterium]